VFLREQDSLMGSSTRTLEVVELWFGIVDGDQEASQADNNRQ